MANVRWTAAEQQAVQDEGVRLAKAGFAGSLQKALDEAQKALPKARRRSIATTGKVPWFGAAVRAARNGAGGHQSNDMQSVAHKVPAAAKDAPAADPAADGRHLVRWSMAERLQLCDEAARLIRGLEASSPHDALVKAQAKLLPSERRRNKLPPSTVASWYPEALQAAMQRLRESEQQSAATPEPAREEPEAATAPDTPCTAPVEVSATTQLAPAVTTPTVASMLPSPWAALREHLVGEIAHIVAEGVMRGLESVRLLGPRESTDEQQEAPRHVPFVAGEPPKPRRPSVLVVGLKGATAAQIDADFRKHLDLRFCEPDKSKDQLRSMTENAQTTVAVVDFISHSHTDIIKARSKHYIESSGGMTRLRQQLAQLAGLNVNGHAL